VGNLKEFDPEKAVGVEHVVTFKRYMCRVCKQYMPTEEEVADHLRQGCQKKTHPKKPKKPT
jgi:hypothetical protein